MVEQRRCHITAELSGNGSVKMKCLSVQRSGARFTRIQSVTYKLLMTSGTYDKITMSSVHKESYEKLMTMAEVS